jgi:hypothetical protein
VYVYTFCLFGRFSSWTLTEKIIGGLLGWIVALEVLPCGVVERNRLLIQDLIWRRTNSVCERLWWRKETQACRVQFSAGSNSD